MTGIKTEQEIKIITVGGKILSQTLSEVLKAAKPGVSELELDRLADELIKKSGAEPGFKKVYGYKYATCISVNEEVVHGIPTDRILQEGDVVCIDCGVFYKGFHTDMAETLRVKTQNSKLKTQNDEEVDKFLKTGKRALEEAIKVAKEGNRVGHISKTIQDIVEGDGYSVVKTLVGHGIGKNLHEQPEIPGFLKGSIDKTPLLKTGMTLAVEIIYNMGGNEVEYEGSDDWTIVTKDKSISAVFERTIVITNSLPLILTPLKM